MTLRAALLAVAVLFPLAASAQQDVVTVGTVNATGNTVDVPVSIRDVAATPLGIDQPAGSKIQSFSIKVSYAPIAAVSSVTFTRAGITQNLTPKSEFAPAASGSISLLDTFQESTNAIPFTLNAPPPGNVVAHLVFTLSNAASPGSQITLTLDPTLTQLTDEGGDGATKETVANNRLSIVNGAINLPPLTVSLTPFSQTFPVGTSRLLQVAISAPVATNTTVTLTSSNTAAATITPSVTINAGATFTNATVTGVATGSSTITATLPQSAGGGTATAQVSVTPPPPNCPTPAAPSLSGPTGAESGSAYTISWPSVTNATEYLLDEATDADFVNVLTTTLTATSATFSHAGNNVRYYYRVRAHNRAGACDVLSLNSNVVSVLITMTPPPIKRFIPVAGSAAGSFGSFFKTSVQLFNPKSTAVSGKIVFHAQGVAGSASDPTLAYSIPPGKTVTYADLLPAMGVASGVGSVDIVGDAGSPLPVALVRVFNDSGAAGTTGLAESQLSADAALQPGDSGALLAPADVQRFRLNIGVRTLDQGATVTITVRDKDGNVVKSLTKSYDPTYFVQVGSAAMLDGYTLTGGETIVFNVTAGSAFFYGATTDNTTNDPSVQFATRIE